MSRNFKAVSKEDYLSERREKARFKALSDGKLEFKCIWCGDLSLKPEGRGQRDRRFCNTCEQNATEKLGDKLSVVVCAGFYKWRAIKKGIEFDLDQDYLYSIFPRDFKCPVFNVTMRINTRTAPSLDRKDSSKGYIKGNVEYISLKANQMKTDASIKELKMLVSYLESKSNE